MTEQKYTYNIERYYDPVTMLTHVSVKLYPQGISGGLTERQINDLQVLRWSYTGEVSEPKYIQMVQQMLDAYGNITNSRI